MRIELKRLRQIIAISECGSFSRAADALGISQPALSRSIGLIEESTGARLFERDRGSVRATAVGVRLIADGRRLLEEAAALEHNLSLWSRSEVGCVRFGIGILPAALLLSELLIHAISNEPRLVLEPIIAPAPDLLGQLANDDIELLICPTKVTDGLPNLKVTKLLDLSFGLFARRGHPLASGNIVEVSDANKFSVLSSRYISGSFETHGLVSSVLCDDFHVLKKILVDSDALFYCSSEFLTEELTSGSVTKLITPWLDAQTSADIAVVTKYKRERSVAAGHVVTAAIAVAEKINRSNCGPALL